MQVKVHQVHQGHQDHKVHQDHQDHEELKEDPALQVLRDHQVYQARREMLDQ
jgi:hypothetical protein